MALSLGFLGTLPVETFCQVVRSLDGQGFQDFLRAYPQYREQILDCLETLPLFRSSREVIPFLRAHPALPPLPLPPGFFRNGEDDSLALQVSPPDLQFVSQRIQGDLYVSLFIDVQDGWGEGVRSLLNFFLVRALLYPQSLTAVVLAVSLDVGEFQLKLRYKDGFLSLFSSGEPTRIPLSNIIRRLPITELRLENITENAIEHRLAFQEIFLYLSGKKIETYYVTPNFIPGYLQGLVQKGTPIRTLRFEGVREITSFLSSVEESFPEVREVWGVPLRTGEEARRFVSLFPNLQSLTYSSSLLPSGRLQAEYPGLSIQYIAPPHPLGLPPPLRD